MTLPIYNSSGRLVIGQLTIRILYSGEDVFSGPTIPSTFSLLVGYYPMTLWPVDTLEHGVVANEAQLSEALASVVQEAVTLSDAPVISTDAEVTITTQSFSSVDLYYWRNVVVGDDTDDGLTWQG